MRRVGSAGNWRVPVLCVGALLLGAAVGGALLGTFVRLDLPDVRALEDYTPPLMTRVLAADGTTVGSFAEQRRILIEYRDIPEVFRQALLASEDSEFERHPGIDPRGIARAAWQNLVRLRAAQGASTITQQLARNLFLHPDKTIRRKLQEVLLALEIERHYTKEEILRFYCNQIYMGHGRYGIEAASWYYFGQPVRDLDLPRAALLAGIIQRPEALSPIKNPDRALSRRNYVLDRMLREGFIDATQAGEASAAPVGVSVRRDTTALAPYFVEEVRRLLQATYGEVGVYQSGMEVRTTLDARLQQIANRAMDRGLRELDKRQGWRGAPARVPAGKDPELWEPPAWVAGIAAGSVTDGVVVAVSPGRARVRVGDAVADLGPKEVAWTRRSDPASLLKRGDVIRVRLRADSDPREPALELEQEPEVEAALVAIEPATGAIRALVGGFDFSRSEFDRAIQARRQTGSAFKPFVYAAALAEGRTLADRILDEPTVFVDPTTLAPYQPENYGHKYYGEITLRHALEKSANIATVKLLLEIGYQPVIDLARRLGIGGELRPYPSLALGAFEVSLLELTSAFGAFGNQGVRVEPHLYSEILGPDGVPIERVEPRVRDAVSPQVAYLVTRMLEGVISDGTGAAAASLGRPLAGKTGTTDDFTDAWFVGYSPDLVVGVWVGFDLKKSLGSRETGALAALPIWKTFMEEALEGEPIREFPEPPGISRVAIDRATGLRALPSAGCDPVMPETFLAGTEPGAHCSAAEHLRRLLPYPLHRYEINEQGELAVPRGDLDALLATEPMLRLADRRQRIEVLAAGGAVSLAVRVLDDVPPADLPPAVQEMAARERWAGKDGRAARVVVLGGP